MKTSCCNVSLKLTYPGANIICSNCKKENPKMTKDLTLEVGKKYIIEGSLYNPYTFLADRRQYGYKGVYFNVFINCEGDTDAWPESCLPNIKEHREKEEPKMTKDLTLEVGKKYKIGMNLNTETIIAITDEYVITKKDNGQEGCWLKNHAEMHFKQHRESVERKVELWFVYQTECDCKDHTLELDSIVDECSCNEVFLNRFQAQLSLKNCRPGYKIGKLNINGKVTVELDQ